jgi:hypothetical protein
LDPSASSSYTRRQSGRGLETNANAKTLRIDVTGTDFQLSHSPRAAVVRSVLLALSRFGGRVQKVTVHMAEPTNPLGGVDQRCRMRAWLGLREDVRSEAINGRIQSAVTRAATRLAKRVAFALDGGAPAHSTQRTRSRLQDVPSKRTVAVKPRRRTRLS